MNKLVVLLSLCCALGAAGQEETPEREMTSGKARSRSSTGRRPRSCRRLAGAKATGENGRVGPELVFWGYEQADGRRVFFFACAQRPDFDCATRVPAICPATTTVLETRETSGTLVRRNCRNVAIAAPRRHSSRLRRPTRERRAWRSGSSAAADPHRQFFNRGAAGRSVDLQRFRSRERLMKRLITTAAAVLAFGLLGTGAAQEGHPLKGSWLGEWAGNTVHGDNILLILDWDGKAITGMINPGTDNIPLKAGVARAERLGRQARSRRQGQGRQRGALRHRRQAREPRAAESLDQRHVVEQQGPRRVHGEQTMRLRGAVTVWCVGLCAAFGGSLAVAHHADHGEVRRCETHGAARHRDGRRLAQSARARVHERHARERRRRELGRRAREHGAAAAQRLAARHAASRRRDQRQRPRGARRLAPGVGRERRRVGDEPPGLQRHRLPGRIRRSRRARRRAAPTASRCSAPPTAPAAIGPIRRARCSCRPVPTCR